MQHKQQICNCHKLESRSTQNVFLLSLFCVMLYQLKDILCWIGENITTSYSLSWTDNGHRGDNESCSIKMSRLTDIIQNYQVHANGTMIPSRRRCLSSSVDEGTTLSMAWKKLGFDSRWGQEIFILFSTESTPAMKSTQLFSRITTTGAPSAWKRHMRRAHLVPRLRMSAIRCLLGKCKVLPVLSLLSTTPWRRIGEWMYISTFSWPLHWSKVSGQLYTPAVLPRGKRPRYLLDRRLGGPHRRSRRYGEVKVTAIQGLWALGSSSP
jgi:hypothetical protein